ncbi:dTDP-4-dehydrorhamnose 3,5-epimerase [Thiomicrorhabdus sp. 6S3-12]|uniref:dTDP-4-dehydrorhamnose 3,5-epimerase n=1 Tax=Thiomicrorhabdus sp. 6S3-12 TaxID=2819681 RepID=UPI001AADE391|nr:dTDP-4-dehydrorhamnose 3,5-epimerase [Thiomicrorhabdus sp. 6S3-12]MBO1922998.1 dTDP-4-dehydrorhamnose 3,5-epimerase [Thiomicrorhabdus sp. 6S3-12]
MEFLRQYIPEVFLIKPRVFGDDRGYFLETFRQDEFEEAIGYKVDFCQDNESKSSKGVVRGLHFQLPPYAQSKLVRVIDGRVMDVAVDIRQGSPTFGQYVAYELSAENKHQLFVPRGFAHGFVVLSDTAIFAYKVDNYYSPDHDRGLAFDDPSLNIDWKLPVEYLKLSDKDKKQPVLEMLDSGFKYGVNYYA